MIKFPRRRAVLFPAQSDYDTKLQRRLSVRRLIDFAIISLAVIACALLYVLFVK